jgi:hypothetical protein
VSAGLAVLMYVAALIIFILSTAPPTTGGAAMLEYVDAHRTVYIVRQVLWLAPSLLLMVFLALAIALHHLGKSFASVVGVVGVVSWALSFAWPTTGEGSLAMIRLSEEYANATTDAGRAAFVAGAELLIALIDAQAAIGVLQTLSILLISVLMLRGVFARSLAWLGVATGAIGIASEVLRPLLGAAYAIYGVLIMIWLIWLAWALWKLGATSARVGATRGAQGDRQAIRASGRKE